MEVYRVAQDYDNYKFFVYKQDDSNSSKRSLEFKGQSLKESWLPIHLELFIDPKKKKDSRKEDFDASCYFPGVLIIKSSLDETFKKVMGERIELLPIVGNNKPGNYLFVNVTITIDAIKKEELAPSDLMALIRENKLSFHLDRIEKELIFRDNKLTNNYYCTNKFVEFTEDNKIKGLRFEKVGEAK